MAGQIIDRGERTYLVRVFMGRGADGKRKYHNKTVHGRKRDAQTYLNKVLRERDTGEWFEPTKMIVDEYFDKWLATARPRLAARTHDEYERLLKRYARPILGDKHLGQVTVLDVQGMYDGMTEQGLSPRTIQYLHAVVRQAFGQAVKWRMIRENPTVHTDRPKQRRQEMQALSPDQARLFLTTAKKDPYYPIFSLLLATGLRPSEAVALRWSDIDFKAKTLTVRRTLTGRTGKQRFEEPKTPKSRRTVPIITDALQALGEHRMLQRAMNEGQYPDDGLIFPGNREGLPVDLRTLGVHLKAVLKEAGLPTMRLYDLRHTCATLLMAAGVQLKIISELLGHASIVLTADTYQHVSAGMTEQASAQLETLLNGTEAHKR